MQFVCYGFDKSHKYLGKLFSLVKSFPKPLQKHAWSGKTLKPWGFASNSTSFLEKAWPKTLLENLIFWFVNGSLLTNWEKGKIPSFFVFRYSEVICNRMNKTKEKAKKITANCVTYKKEGE